MPILAAWPSRGLLSAYDRAYAVDPTSAFGGIIAFNRPLDAATACGNSQAPVRRSGAGAGTSPPTRCRCSRQIPMCAARGGRFEFRVWQPISIQRNFRWLLVQDADTDELTAADLNVSRVATTPAQMEICLSRGKWRCSSSSTRSSTRRTGRRSYRRRSDEPRGQRPDRRPQAEEAGLSVPGSVMASDAFFRSAMHRCGGGKPASLP